ncbi:hypothetical protein H8D85_01705 [bacterium]|nr:hypothetical protein [bacterium]
MIVLDSLDVTSSNLESLTLTWSFKSDPREDFSNYTIDVYRCEAPSESISEYDLVASGISSTAYSYNDTSVSGLHDPHRTWYYKFKVINSTDSEESIAMEKPSYLHDVSTNRFYKEIIRRKNKVLNRFSGRDMTLLKRRS